MNFQDAEAEAEASNGILETPKQQRKLQTKASELPGSANRFCTGLVWWTLKADIPHLTQRFYLPFSIPILDFLS